MASKAVELSQALSEVVESVSPSVLRVEGGRRRPTTGVVWSKGRLITVAHGLGVDEVEVVRDGETFKAQVRGIDASTDLALLEVDESLPAPAWDDGAGVKVGQLVLQLGRPGETVRASSGILSAAGKRAWRSERGGEIDRYLEADARHQPGFSGGPLVTVEGSLLGIVTTGLVRATSVVIPTTTIRRVIDQLEQHGRVRHSWLGLSMQPVTLPRQVRDDTGEDLGLLVVSVESGGPAEQAGIKYGDTLLHLGDDTIRSLEDLYRYLRADHVGEQVPAKLYRSGKVEQVQVTLGAHP